MRDRRNIKNKKWMGRISEGWKGQMGREIFFFWMRTGEG